MVTTPTEPVNDSNCVLQIAYRFSEFLFVESCFQCIACKSGTNQATSALRKLIDGTGRALDVELVLAAREQRPVPTVAIFPSRHRCSFLASCSTSCLNLSGTTIAGAKAAARS